MTKQVPDFWVGLQWLPDAQILWEVVDRHQGHILTSLAYSDPNSGPGKLQWLENNIGLTDRSRIHLKMRWQKCEYALTDNMSNILIDDYIKNINEWREAGGIGILHENVSTTLEVLKKYGIQ